MNPKARTHPPIQIRYRDADTFNRVTVLRGATNRGPRHPESWIVVGPGLKWVGEPFTTFAEAIDYANSHIASARRAFPDLITF